MLLATCALSAAGLGRIPILPPGTFYAGVDFLIVLGVIRDLIVNRRIHSVYKVGLPLFAAGQALRSLHSGDQAGVVVEDRIRNRWMTAAKRLRPPALKARCARPPFC